MIMGKNDFEKLNGKNYVDWAWQMEAYLVSKDLWDVVDGSEKCPMGSEGSKAVRAFRKKQRLACAEITLHVETSEKAHTRDKDPAVIWKALQDHHHARGLSSRMALLRLFFSSVMDAEQTVSDWIAHVKDLAYRLETDDFSIPKEIVIYVLTAGLPHEEFKHFNASLDSIPPDELTLDLVTTRLLNEDARQQAIAIERPSTVAYSARATRNVVCYACNKKGHYASDCPTRKASSSRVSKDTRGGEEKDAALAEDVDLEDEVAGLAMDGIGPLAI